MNKPTKKILSGPKTTIRLPASQRQALNYMALEQSKLHGMKIQPYCIIQAALMLILNAEATDVRSRLIATKLKTGSNNAAL